MPDEGEVFKPPYSGSDGIGMSDSVAKAESSLSFKGHKNRQLAKPQGIRQRVHCTRKPGTY
jgi:hypothetical protein